MKGRNFMLEYNRLRAVAYALFWAFGRNPAYFDFSDLGGDCTNFVSQSIYAGSGVMNYTPTFGWYYISPDDRSPSWTGVEFLYDFLVSNEGPGPFGEETSLQNVALGDVVQLSFDGETYSHALIVTGIRNRFQSDRRILVSAHSYDARNRPLSTYDYEDVRFIHILGVNE